MLLENPPHSNFHFLRLGLTPITYVDAAEIDVNVMVCCIASTLNYSFFNLWELRINPMRKRRVRLNIKRQLRTMNVRVNSRPPKGQELVRQTSPRVRQPR